MRTIEEQVLEANQRFYDAIERFDLDAMEACWEPSGRTACVHPGGEWLVGWDRINAAWTSIFHNTDYLEFRIENVRAEIEDPMAWVTCTERVMSSTPGGRVEAEVAATNVFVLTNAGWRMVLHHASPVIRPGGAEEE
ncbi:MAG: nuclear transport factor 2 family protein [Actinobacteria bacterium]|nr:nuclear transport factor 2 family protein [Actinomycetota bacterium]